MAAFTGNATAAENQAGDGARAAYEPFAIGSIAGPTECICLSGHYGSGREGAGKESGDWDPRSEAGRGEILWCADEDEKAAGKTGSPAGRGS